MNIIVMAGELQLSISSFTTAIFFCNLLIAAFWLLLQYGGGFERIGNRLILLFTGFLLIRFLLPLEFPVTTTFTSKRLMPKIYDFMLSPLGDTDFTVYHIFLLIWGAGSIFTLIRVVRTRAKFKHEVEQLKSEKCDHLDGIVKQIVSEYPKQVDFEVICSSEIPVPMLYDFRQPKILLPIMDLTPTEWRLILKHEIAHYYRKDLQIKLIIEVLQILYWWNPFLYLLSSAIDRMQEIQVDYEVTENMSELERCQYIECLLNLAKTISVKKIQLYSAAFQRAGSVFLTQRFHLVLDQCKKPKHFLAYHTIVTVSIIFLLFFSSLAVFEPYSVNPEHVKGTFDITRDNSYLIRNDENGYDLYVDDAFMITITEIIEPLTEIKIYDSIEEAENDKTIWEIMLDIMSSLNTNNPQRIYLSSIC